MEPWVPTPLLIGTWEMILPKSKCACNRFIAGGAPSTLGFSIQGTVRFLGLGNCPQGSIGEGVMDCSVNSGRRTPLRGPFLAGSGDIASACSSKGCLLSPAYQWTVEMCSLLLTDREGGSLGISPLSVLYPSLAATALCGGPTSWGENPDPWVHLV